MKRYPYQEAKEAIDAICAAAAAGEFDSREKLLAMLNRNPHVAIQGYNAYGIIFYWNAESVRVYGHREAKAVNQDLVDLILPPEMRPFVRDAIYAARTTGRMPAPGPCDLLRSTGESVTVYAGHLVFQFSDSSIPEFYCIVLPVESGATDPSAPALGALAV